MDGALTNSYNSSRSEISVSLLFARLSSNGEGSMKDSGISKGKVFLSESFLAVF